ncbi:MAG TPA: DUF5606 domain-containing protein [Tenuifilaceae bacterium]|nr:DUF5606 domain-containing protein [Tenuifilaceae bacterium]HPE18808.1 DUF5606 domain-containing protein [Tenuifilaceae bacterium]HPJ46007.1 DUF5606 domain-containing protein [Tenuifilaceae bacterium]HPQ34387.1 DUF5606 domain-containing protein [Tenuifilaceae bacterium]HRX68547.1 DUF5606 domain-containing protein [Tenuifilaceae bacterium]
MALKEIMAISGYSGLFKFVSQGRNGIIVESMTDGKRTHIPATAKVSALSDISIFTMEGEKPLREILSSIKQKENGGPTISHKSTNDELKTFFLSIVPDYDSERVYVSDIKKIVTWYNQLQSVNLLDFSEEVEEEIVKEEEAKTEAHKDVEEKTKPAAKKAATQKKTTVTDKKSSSAKAKSATVKNAAPKRKTSTNKKSG